MYKRLPFPILIPVILLLAAVILTVGQSSVGAQQPSTIPNPQWGTDIRVNPTTTAPLIAQRNIAMAVNPLNPNLVIASYDNNEKDIRYSGRATSTDAGLTWDAGRFVCCWGNGLQPLGDTQVAFDSLGRGYYTSIGISQAENGYYVLTTTNGINWSTPVPIVVTNGEEYRFQSNLAVDTGAGSPFANSLYFSYLFYNLSEPFYQGVWIRHSRDQARTWSPQIKVSDEGREYSRSPSVAVASNGVVYLAYEHVENYLITNPPEHYIDRSTDGGVTWGTDTFIGGAPIVPIGIPDFKNREFVLITDNKCSMARMFHYVQIAVSPLDPNTVYAVWNDGRWDSQFSACNGTGKHSDIAFIRSTDGGVTWTAPMRVNDDPIGNGRDQYQPTIAVAPDGTIGLTWYDRRYSSNGFLYDLAYSQSTDGGITWSPNVRVSDVSSDAREVPDYKSINDVSYRKALVYGPNYALPGWLDTRRGNQQGDFMVDRGTFALITPTPTLTLTPTPTQTQASVTATPTRTPAQVTVTPTPTQTQASVTNTPTRTATPTSTPGQTTATVTPAPCTITFTDVPTSNTFYEAIRCLACRGIISGYSDGTFRPNNQVTRGQLAKIVSNSAGFSETPTQQTFEDVLPTNTFYEWIERLTVRGYMTGYLCGGPGEPCITGKPYFRPFANATRGQTAKIVSNAAGFTELPVGQTFEDVPPSHTFYEFIQRLASRNVMGGYPCGGVGEPCISGRPYFRPGNDVTRGQSSKIVANAFFPTCSIEGR